VALEWFSAACPLVSDHLTKNWKILKKWLVAAIFGDLEGQFLMPGWTPEQVSLYVQPLLSGLRTMRISAIPTGISCHARSETFDPTWSLLKVLEFVRSFDAGSALHVFPQQDANQLCFRAVYGEEIVLEAGWGQAMYVFEAERGRHAIVTARIGSELPLAFQGMGRPPAYLLTAMSHFLADQGDWLQSVGPFVSNLLGIEQFAIEGYFDPDSPERVVVVDMDLPLDIAWNTSR
jgi:hypothetical protein